jgi:hypothetical protein
MRGAFPFLRLRLPMQFLNPHVSTRPESRAGVERTSSPQDLRTMLSADVSAPLDFLVNERKPPLIHHSPLEGARVAMASMKKKSTASASYMLSPRCLLYRVAFSPFAGLCSTPRRSRQKAAG